MKLSSEISLFSHVSKSDVLNLTKNISVMIKAGITLPVIMETLINQAKSPALNKVLQSIRNDVVNGIPLNKALARFPKIFDNFHVNIIKIGEESGNLDKNLEYLATKLRKEDSLGKKIREALFYPTILISAALIVGLGVSLFVLPKLTDLFNSLDVKLPATTVALMAFANFMKKYNIIVVVGIIAFIVLFRLFISWKPIKPIWQSFLFSMPVIGPFLMAAEAGAFCRNLGIMLNSGISIVKALEILQDTTSNVIYIAYAKKLQAGVEDGKSLGSLLATNQFKYFPPVTAKMIMVGETSGKLSDMLGYSGDYYEEESDTLAKNFSTALEPILLVTIALIVGIMALAIITPIYQVTSSIG